MLNTAKSLVIDISLSPRPNLNAVPAVDGATISKVTQTKLLGVVFDEMLSFSLHVDNLVSKCASRKFFLYALKRLNLATAGLLTFYFSKIRTNILYACAVWYPVLSKHNRTRLESIERWSLRIIFPDLNSYNDRILEAGMVPILEFLDFIVDNHFNKISQKDTHPLRKFLVKKERHRDKLLVFYPPKCRTEKFRNSFIVSGMRKNVL